MNGQKAQTTQISIRSGLLSDLPHTFQVSNNDIAKDHGIKRTSISANHIKPSTFLNARTIPHHLPAT
jgi:hypothetical protein